MSHADYDLSYFERYHKRVSVTRRVLGKRGVGFWTARLRRVLGDGARLLEVGAGAGYFGAEARQHFDYVGTDISEDAVAWSREHLGLELQVADAQRLPFDDASFDGLVAFDVTEHLPDPSAFFAEAQRVLRPGGYLHVRTPNTHSLGVRLKKNHPALTASMDRDATHCSLLAPEAWRQLVREAGFTIIRDGTDGLWDLPYSTTVPVVLQKLTILPFNAVIDRTVGYLPWTLGENLTIEARSSSHYPV